MSVNTSDSPSAGVNSLVSLSVLTCGLEDEGGPLLTRPDVVTSVPSAPNEKSVPRTEAVATGELTLKSSRFAVVAFT